MTILQGMGVVKRIKWVLRAGSAVCIAMGLLSCGGGETLDPFSPTRIIVFGDEQSLLRPDGTKFSINFQDSTSGLVDCTRNPIWTQQLASSFGMVFPGCAGGVAQPQGLMNAQEGAEVAAVVTQIDQHLAVSGFGPHDLVTVFAGLHDLLDLYGQFPGRTEADLVADAKVRGATLAGQINRIAQADGRVLLVTVQDLGLTPFGNQERAVDPARGTLLSDLSAAFNLSLKISVINDGRKIGLVALDALTQDSVSNPAAHSFSNVTDAACTSATLDQCTTATLVPAANGDGSTFLWADATRLSAGGQAQLGSAAELRARRNPF